MAISYQQYLNVRRAAGATFREDGDRMAFLTDISGTYQLWTLDRPLGWPEQLTFFENRLMFARYSPTEPIIAFGKDSGGDEVQLIYMISDEGGEPERLSVQHAKHMFGGWSPDGQKLAWSHNGRNGRDFDVYVYDLATGEETLVLEASGWHFVSDWLPDGSGLLVTRAESNSDTYVYDVPLDGREPTLLTEHDDLVYFGGATSVDGGRSVYLVTNTAGEWTSLARIDRESGELEMVDDTEWDVEAFAFSDDERFLVVVRNEAGYSRVRIHDLENEESRVADLPDGTCGPPRFLPNNHRFSLTIDSTTSPGDVWVVDSGTGASERWTQSSLAGIPRGTIVEPELIEFESFDGLEISGFYWKPANAQGLLPVVIDIHGGPEGQVRPTLRATFQHAVQAGIAVFAPNVRGSRGYGKTFMALDDVRKRMHSVADIKACREWLVSEGGAAPDRIAVMGGSYGGFMVLSAMVTYPDLWAAGIDIVGIADFVTFLENTSEYRRHLREAEYGSLETDREFLHDISPLTHIDKINAPLMVIHGRNDPRVPVTEAEQVIDSCLEKGLPCEGIIYDDEGHGLAKRKNRLDAYPRMHAFLSKHLRVE